MSNALKIELERIFGFPCGGGGKLSIPQVGFLRKNGQHVGISSKEADSVGYQLAYVLNQALQDIGIKENSVLSFGNEYGSARHFYYHDPRITTRDGKFTEQFRKALEKAVPDVREVLKNNDIKVKIETERGFD